MPHIGASTAEAEENCAVMAANQLRAFLEHGNIRNSVNFPAIELDRTTDYRITIANRNEPGTLSHILTLIGDDGLNVADLLNKSVGVLDKAMLHSASVSVSVYLWLLSAMRAARAKR